MDVVSWVGFGAALAFALAACGALLRGWLQARELADVRVARTGADAALAARNKEYDALAKQLADVAARAKVDADRATKREAELEAQLRDAQAKLLDAGVGDVGAALTRTT